MKFLSLGLWLAAIVLAAGILWQARRGRKTFILQGRLSPALIRMVVLCLILVGFHGPAEAEGQEGSENLAETTQPFPLNLARRTFNSTMWWNERLASFKEAMALATSAEGETRSAAVEQATVAAADLPDVVQQLVVADLANGIHGEAITPPTAEELATAIAALEVVNIYDSWLAGYLWHLSADAAQSESPDAAALAKLYAAVEFHVRLTDTITLVQASDPRFLQPRAWMSKAMNPVRERGLEDDFQAAARATFPETDAGTWEEESVFYFEAVAGTATLHRRGEQHSLELGQNTKFRRLDLITVAGEGEGVTLRHDVLGDLSLPPGAVLTPHNAASFLSNDAQEQIAQWVAAASSGNEESLLQIERVLPLAQTEIRRQLEEAPQAVGAAALRMLLVTFDE